MDATGNAAKFGLNSSEIGFLSGIVLIFLCEVLNRYTHWDLRICFLLVAIPIWVAQGFLFRTPPKKWAIQVVVSVAICYFVWELLNLVWK
jgi:cytochrome b subunit of formate dehydrogenase